MSFEDSHCVHAMTTLLWFISNVIFTVLSAFIHADTLTANVFREKASFIEAMTSLKWQTEEKQNNFSFFHYLYGFFLLLFIIITVAGSLCVPKQITGIQLEVSYLSFPARWPEWVNPVSVRMAALHSSCLIHVTHRLCLSCPHRLDPSQCQQNYIATVWILTRTKH